MSSITHCEPGSLKYLSRIKTLGYGVQEYSQKAPDTSQTTDFRIIGMDCPDCAAKLEKSISNIPGAENTQVNFGASKITVTHNGPASENLVNN